MVESKKEGQGDRSRSGVSRTGLAGVSRFYGARKTVNGGRMCCRYVMQSDALRVLAERLGIARPLEWRSRYNLAPSADVPVVRASPGADGLEMVTLRWGLVPAWTREAEPARAPSSRLNCGHGPRRGHQCRVLFDRSCTPHKRVPSHAASTHAPADLLTQEPAKGPGEPAHRKDRSLCRVQKGACESH